MQSVSISRGLWLALACYWGASAFFFLYPFPKHLIGGFYFIVGASTLSIFAFLRGLSFHRKQRPYIWKTSVIGKELLAFIPSMVFTAFIVDLIHADYYLFFIYYWYFGGTILSIFLFKRNQKNGNSYLISYLTVTELVELVDRVLNELNLAKHRQELVIQQNGMWIAGEIIFRWQGTRGPENEILAGIENKLNLLPISAKSGIRSAARAYLFLSIGVALLTSWSYFSPEIWVYPY